MYFPLALFFCELALVSNIVMEIRILIWLKLMQKLLIELISIVISY